MILQYCSDLHLEFWENRDMMEENPLQPKADILLLGGDIVPFAFMDKYDDFFDFISESFELVYWVPGNHEYYHADAGMRSGKFQEKIRENVYLVNNTSFQHDNVKLIFSTLWSKISPVNEASVQRSVNDFKLIEYNGNLFSPDNFNRLHLDSLDFLKEEISKSYKGKTVVISHHVPTFLNYPEKYRGDRLNEVFGVELSDFIEASGIDYWIYGHHHNNIADFSIGKTQLLTNQLGYVRADEHHLFSPTKTIKP
ncbi:MAG TPA: metallophosphoesterase [Puia sp.]|nr:metallophosphoesterase [Puia sp.]